MRDIILLVVGVYLTIALVVFGGAAWHFNTDEKWKYSTCATPGDLKVNIKANEPMPELAGEPNWLPWAGYRALLWPKTYFDDAAKTKGVIEWLLVQYNPFPQFCR